MKAGPKRVARLLRWVEPEAVEVFGGLLAVSYGLWLLCPWPVYGTMGKNAYGIGPYSFAASVWGNEILGGCIIAALGALSVAEAAFQLAPRARTATQAGVATYWIVVFVSLVAWHWPSTGTPVYGVIALAHVWSAWRLRRMRRGE